MFWPCPNSLQNRSRYCCTGTSVSLARRENCMCGVQLQQACVATEPAISLEHLSRWRDLQRKRIAAALIGVLTIQWSVRTRQVRHPA